MASLSGEKTLAQLSVEFGVHPTMISNWKQELVTRAGELFGRGSKAPAADDAQKVIDDLHRKIGQLQVECDFLAGAARHLPSAERRAMIAPKAALSVTRQCALLGIARSSFYYRPRPESAEELEILRRLDQIFTNHPVYGNRRLQVTLLREGISIGRRRVRQLMRKLGLWAVRPKRNASKRHPAHKIYPYLLRGKTIDQPNQSLPSRKRGAQFTSDEFTQMLRDHGIEISMDGRGRCHDNIFVERLWWTVKHEWVYLRPAADCIEQKRSLGEFFDWYNLRRPHQALGWRTPDEAYLGQSSAATARAA